MFILYVPPPRPHPAETDAISNVTSAIANNVTGAYNGTAANEAWNVAWNNFYQGGNNLAVYIVIVVVILILFAFYRILKGIINPRETVERLVVSNARPEFSEEMERTVIRRELRCGRCNRELITPDRGVIASHSIIAGVAVCYECLLRESIADNLHRRNVSHPIPSQVPPEPNSGETNQPDIIPEVTAPQHDKPKKKERILKLNQVLLSL